MQWDILRVVCVFVVFLFSYICFDVCICTLKGLYTDALHSAGKFKSRSRSGFYTAIVFRGKVSQIAWCLFQNVFPTERQTKAEPSADLKWNPVFASRPQKLNICKYTFFFFFTWNIAKHFHSFCVSVKWHFSKFSAALLFASAFPSSVLKSLPRSLPCSRSLFLLFHMVSRPFLSHLCPSSTLWCQPLYCHADHNKDKDHAHTLDFLFL